MSMVLAEARLARKVKFSRAREQLSYWNNCRG